VTPWFAAGAGFVIAAGLALHSPHTVLTYRPNTQPCKHGCEQPVPSGGSAAVVTPGVRIKTPKPVVHPRHRHVRPTHGSSAGALVGFRVMWHQAGRFGAFITIPAHQARHAWRLRFDIPGTKIVQVWGAPWPSAAGCHSAPQSWTIFVPGMSKRSLQACLAWCAGMVMKAPKRPA